MAYQKPEEFLNILFDRIEDNPVLDSDDSEYYVPFYKRDDYFESYELQVKFIKEVEKVVRKHPYYKKHIKYLIDVVGIRTCQVLSNVEVSDKKEVTIEMHHGPILTLFDITSIVLNWMIVQGENITTFSVAERVIEEHRLNNVRVILLSKTIHQLVHDDNIFLNYNQGFGDSIAFLEKYKLGLDRSTAHRINQYIQWSKDNDSFDNDVLHVEETMKCWDDKNQMILWGTN